MNYYFEALDSEHCYPRKTMYDIMISRGIYSLMVYKANRIIGADMMFCKKYQEVGEKGNCGVICKHYRPRNLRNGNCIHTGMMYEHGKKVTLINRKNMQVSIFDVLNDIDNKEFRRYHENHPDVYKKFVALSFETKSKGFKRFSARGVFQVMRWLSGGKIKPDGFKYNNNYTPYYVRLLEFEHPKFIGFYEKRKVKNQNLILKEDD